MFKITKNWKSHQNMARNEGKPCSICHNFIHLLMMNTQKITFTESDDLKSLKLTKVTKQL